MFQSCEYSAKLNGRENREIQSSVEYDYLRQMDLKNCGYQVELTDRSDQTFAPSPIKFSKLEDEAINKEI